MKKTPIQILKDSFQIVNMSLRRIAAFAPAFAAPDAPCFPTSWLRNIFPIAHRVSAINRLAVHLGQQNVRDGPYHRVRRTFQQIGKPYQKSALTQANRVIDVSESKKSIC